MYLAHELPPVPGVDGMPATVQRGTVRGDDIAPSGWAAEGIG
ncbi:hypothetical protein GCM10019016_126900 [Streptomyces prasinosporus]|uniref:Uncharacterized protein n=1 Tax=Streptomyces prasinosporus TaxID=68256 RepID=A0ABP6UD67_9ACTN